MKEIEKLADIAGDTAAEPLIRDFRKKKQRSFTGKEGPNVYLSKIYEMYVCGYLNKKKTDK